MAYDVPFRTMLKNVENWYSLDASCEVSIPLDEGTEAMAENERLATGEFRLSLDSQRQGSKDLYLYFDHDICEHNSRAVSE